MTEKSFLAVENLVVEYTSEGKIIHAVNHVSFKVERGKTLGLVGETGAGKTSIAKAILRILPDPPAKIRDGEIFLDNKDILKLSEAGMCKVRGSKASMVFQDPMTALNPVMKIGNQIAEVIELHNKISKKESAKRAAEMLEMVGIPSERCNEYPHQFSGGMKQRVMIAIALACNPDLLIADEPTTALDVTIQAQVLDMINTLKRERNTAMIMITHDLGVVAEVCDDVAVVYAGEIVEYGSKDQIFDHPFHPYTRGLFGALPDLDEDSERLSPIAGLPPNPSNLPEGCYFNPRCPFADEKCSVIHSDLTMYRPEHLCRCRLLEKQEVPNDSVN